MASCKALLAAAVALVVLSGCGKEEAAVAEAPASEAVQPAAAVTEAPAAGEPAQAAAPAAPEAAPFDVATVPVSDKPLGDWPYLAVPAGYEYDGARTLDLSRVPFWTGQSLQFVEGKVHETRINASGEKEYSRFELLKRVDEALLALGAVKVTTSKVPDQVLKEQLPEDFGVEFNTGAGGYYGNQEVSTYVLRHADQVTWFKVYSDTNSASLLIAETRAPAAATGG